MRAAQGYYASSAVIDLADAQVFLDVLDARSFSAVARQRGVAATTLARAVDRLEAAFALTMLHRSSRRLEPTSAGLAAAERLRALVDESSNVMRDVGALREHARGTVRASVCAAYARRKLAVPIALFSAEHPAVSVDLVLEDRWLDLAAENVDLAIRTGAPPLASGSIATPIDEHRFAVVGAPRFTSFLTRPEDLARVPIIAIRTEKRWFSWPFRKGREEVTVRVRPAIEVNDAEMARALVVAGAGVAALPEYLVEDEHAKESLAWLLTGWMLPSVPVVAIHPRRARMTAAARALLETFARGSGERKAARTR